MATKQCIDCPQGLLKDTSEFWAARNNRRPDGLMPTRKECTKARRRAWASRNRDKETAYSRAQYVAHPDRSAERSRQWALDHPDAYLALKRNNQSTRRARKLDQFVETVDHSVVYEMHGGMCGICKEFIEGDFHVDHIVPLSKGGLHGYFNVQPAHPRCNMSKGSSYGL